MTAEAPPKQVLIFTACCWYNPLCTLNFSSKIECAMQTTNMPDLFQATSSRPPVACESGFIPPHPLLLLRHAHCSWPCLSLLG